MTTMSELCEEQLVILDTATSTYSTKVAAIQVMLDAVDVALADPVLYDVTQDALPRHTAVMALEHLRSTIYAKRDAVLGANVRPRTFMVPVNGEPMSLPEIARSLWGDATRWADLLEGNAIHTPNMVAPGTVLRVLR